MAEKRYIHINKSVKLYPVLNNIQIAMLPSKKMPEKDRIFIIVSHFDMSSLVIRTRSVICPPSRLFIGSMLSIMSSILLVKIRDVISFFGNAPHKSARRAFVTIPAEFTKRSEPKGSSLPSLSISAPNGRILIDLTLSPVIFIAKMCPASCKSAHKKGMPE